MGINEFQRALINAMKTIQKQMQILLSIKYISLNNT